MPTSDIDQIPDVLRVVMGCRAESVLEVGIGFGKWGALCREYIEISRGRMPAEWRSRIDGIEVFDGYRNPLWSVYDHVYVGDAMTIIESLGRYDLVLCCDVIEHFEKAEGQRMLAKMLAHGKVVVITSPHSESPQEAVYGNPHEEHRSLWTEADFAAWPHRFAKVTETFVAAVAHEESQLAGVDLRPLDERLGFRNVARMGAELARRRLASRILRRRP